MLHGSFIVPDLLVHVGMLHGSFIVPDLLVHVGMLHGSFIVPDLLVHVGMLHCSVMLADPVQPAPAGLHVLLLFLMPDPHVTLHTE